MKILVRLWGSRYRLHAVTLLICSGILFYRWARGYRGVEQFAADPVLSWTALLGSILGLIFVVVWRSKAAGYRPTRKFLHGWPAWVLSITLVIFFAGLRFYSYRYGVWDSFKEGEIGILVGAIPGDQDSKQQNSYMGAIGALVEKDVTLRDVVKVWPLFREFPSNPDAQQEEALRLAGRLRASFVIRPVAEVGGHRPWLTIAGQPEFPRAKVELEKVTNLAELDSMALPRDVALLARCAVALSFYRRAPYPQAVEQFTQILDIIAARPEAATARPYLSFLLGNLHWYQRPSDPALFLPQAIAAYDSALEEWSRERYPTDWAMTMNNRGNAYQELPGPDRAANLREAIRSYDLALKEWERLGERYRTEWAITMNNRGAAYGELPGPDREGNLREAIRSYELALKVRTPDRYPTEWASTMSNRGIAYGQLSGADRMANLEESIHSFDKALEIYTRDRYPTEWARAMSNRGNAYWELPGPDRVANLREAIRSFDLALEVRTRDRYPTDWAGTMNNRGAAYWELPGPDRAANLREALRSYDLALEVRTRERYPTDWAGTMNNRGEAYRELPGPDRAGNLREAIRCYEEALAIWEEQGMTHYAEVARGNLARARSELAEHTNKTGSP